MTVARRISAALVKLIFAVFLVVLLGAVAEAQPPACGGGPCVTVLPASHSVDRDVDPSLSTTLAIEIQICHDEQLNYGSLMIDYNGTTIDPDTLSKSAGDSWGTCVYGKKYYGSVVLSTASEGLNSLSASIEDVNSYFGGGNEFYQYYWPNYTRRTFDVVVTPERWTLERHTNVSGQQARFRVWNRGSRDASYKLTATCTTVAVCSAYTGTARTIVPGDFYLDSVTFSTASAVADTGRIRAVVTGAANGGSLYDAGAKDSVDVSVWTRAPDPVGTAGIRVAHRLDVIDPNSCVGLPAGQGTGAVCGHLMVSHPIPGVTTRNQYRAPSLLYNSNHARPVVVMAVDLTLPDSGTAPDSVMGRLYVNGGQYGGTSKWAGASFAIGRTRRLAISFDAVTAGLATGVHTVRFEARRHHGGTTVTDTVSTRAIVIRRSDKPYGAGWSLAGVEQIRSLSATEKLWIGGDGSARLYTGGSSGPWLPPALAAPDSIVLDGTDFLRWLPDGSRVRFGSDGNLKAVIGRLSDSTSFTISGVGDTARVTVIGVPKWYSNSTFQLSYSSGRLSTVTSPGVGGSRITTIHRTSARLDSIVDADGASVRFTYGTGVLDGRMATRRDRLAAEIQFTYDSARRVARAKQPPSSALNDSIVFKYRWAEADGLAVEDSMALHPDSAYTFFDGARTDVDDHTRFWLTSLGTVQRVRNAHGYETRIAYSDTFPLLPDTVLGPMGERSVATYHPTRGLATKVLTWRLDTASDTARVKTEVTWDAVHPAPAVVTTSGTTDATEYEYDGVGQVASVVRPGAGKDTIEYYTSGAAINLYRRSRHATESIWDLAEYDARGNLTRSLSPRGFATSYVRDSLGRVITTTDTVGRVTQTYYDKMDRDTLTVQSGPAVTYSSSQGGATVPAETLFVRKAYDAEGRLVETGRKSMPNPAELREYFSVTTAYDAAGRAVEQTSDGTRTKVMGYDPSGLLMLETYDDADADDPSVEYQYDALGMLTRRIAVAPNYESRSCTWFEPYGAGIGCDFEFPLWPKAGIEFRAESDTAYFTYDASGRMTGAHNQFARVYRTWTPGGRLQREISQIRTLRYEKEGAQLPQTDFALHTYKLGFSYDLAGRRVELRDSSAVRACSQSSCVQTYSFDPVTGQLETVVDPQNRTYAFAYNAKGQLDTLYHPGSVWEHPTYDIEGNITQRLVRQGTDTLVYDRVTYDLAGRVVSDTGRIVSDGATRTAMMAYSGLGHLVLSETQLGSQPTRVEQFRSDALGNQVWSLRHHVVLGNIDNPAERETFYDQDGRFDYSWAPDELNVTDYKVVWHDDFGRLIYRGTTSNTWGSGQATQYAEEAHYYDGLGRLASFQRKSNDLQQLSNNNDPSGVIERYRYDALGRRVLVHTNRLHTCVVAGCDRTVRRFVWDGDNLLHEIRQKASDTTTNTVVESDTPTGNGIGSGSLNQFGRVYYVHAGGIDRPIGVIRLYSTNSVLTAFSPHSNWRGLYEGGTNSSGDLITNTVTWPGEAASAYLGVNPSSTPDEWLGSLILEQADASGLMYRRNRYYDPQMGRFTQPDPIGLAGGLNLYGYAGGNPIGRRDPFGLCTDDGSDRYTLASSDTTKGSDSTATTNPASCTWSQSTGAYACTDAQGGTMSGGGYSGAPGFQNAGWWEFLRSAGPIPRGRYAIGPARNSPTTGRLTFNLTPMSGTDTFGRDLFRIHGDNADGNRSASQGCPIMGPMQRTWLSGRDGGTLTVVP